MNKQLPPVVSGAKPFIGHAFEFQKDRSALMKRGYEEHGLLFALKLFNQNVAVFIGPDLQQLFYMETDKSLGIQKPYKFLKALFGEVLFIAPREKYLEQRPLVIQAFRRQKMLTYINVMQQRVQRWLDSLGDEGEFEISSVMGWLTQDIAGYALMGEEFQKQVGREFWDLYKVVGQSMDPLLPPHLPLPKFRQRDKAKAKMHKILKPILAERRQNPEKYDDFLQDFVNTGYSNGRELEDEVLLGLMMGLMFAGHETTAGQAAWTVIQLLQNPDYLALVQQEIDEMLHYGEPIEPKVMAGLKHINWAIRETERTRPSADMNMRTVEEEIIVDDFVIPRGWLVQTAVEIGHNLPELWTNPDQYDPLRYAPGREEDKQHRFSLIGFGGGTHKCTGMNFANNEMLVITTLLLQQFNLELVTRTPEIERGLGANRPTETWIRYQRRPATKPVSAERTTPREAAWQ